jgi:Flp pilus assembly protein TadG
MRFCKRLAKSEDGASALEFALIFPLFAAMLFGTVQMGMAYYFAGSVQYALERAARTRMVTDMSSSQMQAAFDAELAPFTDDTYPLSYSVDSSGDVPIATLSATYTFAVVIPFVPSFNITFPVITKVPVAD